MVAFELSWLRAQMESLTPSQPRLLALGWSHEVNGSLSVGTVVPLPLVLIHPLGFLRVSVW